MALMSTVAGFAQSSDPTDSHSPLRDSAVTYTLSTASLSQTFTISYFSGDTIRWEFRQEGCLDSCSILDVGSAILDSASVNPLREEDEHGRAFPVIQYVDLSGDCLQSIRVESGSRNRVRLVFNSCGDEGCYANDYGILHRDR